MELAEISFRSTHDSGMEGPYFLGDDPAHNLDPVVFMVGIADSFAGLACDTLSGRDQLVKLYFDMGRHSRNIPASL
jgi:hypothetical protein